MSFKEIIEKVGAELPYSISPIDWALFWVMNMCLFGVLSHYDGLAGSVGIAQTLALFGLLRAENKILRPPLKWAIRAILILAFLLSIIAFLTRIVPVMSGPPTTQRHSAETGAARG